MWHRVRVHRTRDGAMPAMMGCFPTLADADASQDAKATATDSVDATSVDTVPCVANRKLVPRYSVLAIDRSRRSPGQLQTTRQSTSQPSVSAGSGVTTKPFQNIAIRSWFAA